MVDLLDELARRGLLHQETNSVEQRRHLAAAPRSVYAGFDPTADSLTIGNLVSILLLVHYQRAGHRPIVVMGGGTGLIGDPSGKEAERPIRSREEIERNIAGQRPIFERLLSFEGDNGALIVNNAEWLERLGFIEALRDIGKHFSVNMMIQKDSVRERLQSREQGISYTEFSYMLLQAYDYLHLYDAMNVTVQVAGSDQWGNIVAGIDLIRRVRQTEVFGMTAPLITRADGGKFGKTEKGAIWLTAQQTSPYAFYQFWLNTADSDIPRYLKIFTLLPFEEIEELTSEHERNPAGRAAHRALARHVTELLHGTAAMEQAEGAAKALFSGDIAGLELDLLNEVFASAPASRHPKTLLEGDGMAIVDLLVDTKIATSKRQAREFITNGAVAINGAEVENPEARLTEAMLLHHSVALLRRGKKTWHVTRWE
jgi:tyrosyl-tRNA synthetase